MNPPDKTPFTRREALLDTFKASLVTLLAPPVVADAAPAPCPEPEPEFVPENDYPFFGGELPEGYGSIRFE